MEERKINKKEHEALMEALKMSSIKVNDYARCSDCNVRLDIPKKEGKEYLCGSCGSMYGE